MHGIRCRLDRSIELHANVFREDDVDNTRVNESEIDRSRRWLERVCPTQATMHSTSCNIQLYSCSLHLQVVDSAWQLWLQFVYVILPERCYYICTVVQHSYLIYSWWYTYTSIGYISQGRDLYVIWFNICLVIFNHGWTSSNCPYVKETLNVWLIAEYGYHILDSI